MSGNDYIVNDYLNGKIKDINKINDLYNDMEFMKRLLMQTRKIEYYKLCSNELKSDLKFVKFLASMFEDNLNFIFEVFNNYVHIKGERNLELVEVLYKAKEFLDTREKEIDITYTMAYRRRMIYYNEYMQDKINSYLDEFDSTYKNENLFGFNIMKTVFKKYKHAPEYFADYYLSKIFRNRYFEEYIHDKYKTQDELNADDSIIVLQEFVKFHDLGLYNYCLTHKELLESKLMQLRDVKINFNKYLEDKKEDKAAKFNKELVDYLEKENIELDVCIDIIKLEEIKRLGLDKEIYGKEIAVPDINDIEENNLVNFNYEKIRLFIRKELQKIYKTSIKKLDLVPKDGGF